MTDSTVNAERLDLEVREFDIKRQHVFDSVALELQQAASAPESADFARVVSHAQKVLGKSDLQMSELFKVSRPTVNRWTRGVTAPHPMLRKAVYDSLVVEVRQALKVLRATA